MQTLVPASECDSNIRISGLQLTSLVYSIVKLSQIKFHLSTSNNVIYIDIILSFMCTVDLINVVIYRCFLFNTSWHRDCSIYGVKIKVLNYQLCRVTVHCTAALCLCFRIYKKQVFS